MNKRTVFSFLFVLLFTAAAPASVTPGRVFWRGMVDDRVQLLIRGDRLETRTLSGKAYPDGVYSFTTPMTAGSHAVQITKTKGRGTARVVQQPAEDNDFTAIIEIVDAKGGAKEYQLEISWN